MQVRVDWVLRIFGTQVIEKKRPVRPVFPDYLSVSYDYDMAFIAFRKLYKLLKKQCNRQVFIYFEFEFSFVILL